VAISHPSQWNLIKGVDENYQLSTQVLSGQIFSGFTITIIIIS